LDRIADEALIEVLRVAAEAFQAYEQGSRRASVVTDDWAVRSLSPLAWMLLRERFLNWLDFLVGFRRSRRAGMEVGFVGQMEKAFRAAMPAALRKSGGTGPPSIEVDYESDDARCYDGPWEETPDEDGEGPGETHI